MKTLSLDSDMLAMVGGVFYPSGYAIVMLPSAESAHNAAQAFVESGVSEEDMYFIPPEVILSQIAETIKNSDHPLPSPGSEAGMVREYIQLAQQGHAGLLIPTPDDAASDRLSDVLSHTPYSVARRYHRLVIEDL